MLVRRQSGYGFFKELTVKVDTSNDDFADMKL
jgi:hypothetical protein